VDGIPLGSYEKTWVLSFQRCGWPVEYILQSDRALIVATLPVSDSC